MESPSCSLRSSIAYPNRVRLPCRVRYSLTHSREGAGAGFSLDVKHEPAQGDTITVRACMSSIAAASGMAVLEAGLPTGAVVDMDSLNRLPGTSAIKRVERGDRKAIIYFDSIPRDVTCVAFAASVEAKVANVQPPVSS